MSEKSVNNDEVQQREAVEGAMKELKISSQGESVEDNWKWDPDKPDFRKLMNNNQLVRYEAAAARPRIEFLPRQPPRSDNVKSGSLPLNPNRVKEFVVDVSVNYQTSLLQQEKIILSNLSEQLKSDREWTIDKVLEISEALQCDTETVYLSVSIIDRVFTLDPIRDRYLELLAVTSLLTASKCKAKKPIKVEEIIHGTSYSLYEIIDMENYIVQIVGQLDMPTIYSFLDIFIEGCGFTKERKAILDLTDVNLKNYVLLASNKPSKIAASAIYATWRPFSNWTACLSRYIGYSESDMQNCSDMLLQFRSSTRKRNMIACVKRHKLWIMVILLIFLSLLYLVL